MIAIFVDGANDHYTRGYNFPIGTTPKKISVSELGVIFWGSPLFLAVFGHRRVRGATTLNFGPISTKLGGTVRVIKKMTQKDNGPGRGQNYGETGVFTFIDIMAARKTIVFLIGSLLMGWVVWIIVNFI